MQLLPRAWEASTVSRHRRDGGRRPAGTTASGASPSSSMPGPRSPRTSKSPWPCGAATCRIAVASSRSAKAGSGYDEDRVERLKNAGSKFMLLPQHFKEELAIA